ncbi:Germin-like protein 9-3 [Camellia lanceoleosa]|uniref:Germin-like protein 9-3 n=1 Tax=Camellia lanceoleosa TaxID=1840588 RepID=A0ACC0GB46_9ERIC|nr:Germin-like protein 9-3 [Camellia lanceoleosa]
MSPLTPTTTKTNKPIPHHLPKTMAKTLTLTLILLSTLLLLSTTTTATDPELTTDFSIPDGADESKLDGVFFTYTGLRGGAPATTTGLGRKSVSVKDFPALNGMGVSLELLEFAPNSVNVPHTHPRGGEIIFVVDGSLTVGTVDSNGKLYKNVLQKGDVFLFPKGLPHYQANFDKANKAVVVSAFGSVNAGTVALPKNLFGSNIPDEVLTKAFKISADTVQQLRAGQN